MSAPIAEERFIPATRFIDIGGGWSYRPIRSWHTGAYAGERRSDVHGDRSGCIDADGKTLPPFSAMHRLYVHADGRVVSAFLSYPGGMSPTPFYHWEASLPGFPRFTSEEEMEDAIRSCSTVKEVRR